MRQRAVAVRFRSRLLLCVAFASACATAPGAPQRTAANATPAPESCGADALDCCPAAQPGRVAQCRLFAGLIDLRALTHLPSPDYTSHMQSSFDRASLAAAPGDPNWFANRDFAELTPDQPFALLDVSGPGVVTRMWSANPSGILRVYLDGAPQPALEADMRALLDGRLPGFDGFGAAAASGHDLYLPIAFQTHCTITVTSSARRLYYQVSYRSYAPGSAVERFERRALEDPRGMPHAVSTYLRAQRYAREPDAFGASARFVLGAQGTPSYTLRAPPGGGLVRGLRAQVAASDAALRETLLVISVDGEETVRAPFGDFFGTGPGLSRVRALPVGVEPELRELVSRWPMPFRRELRIALEPSATAPLTAACDVQSQAAPFRDDTLLFHAVARPPEWQPNEPTHEYELAALQGDGLYAGTLLNVTNTEPAWWGEGDEKIWVDDDRFPSLFGTGTEDYFGYGYCSNQLFSRAYIGQSRAGAHQNFGRVSVYRFHIPDPVRFQKRLRFDLEVNHWGKSGRPVEHDSVVYFYARPGAHATQTHAAPIHYDVPVLDVPAPSDVPAAAYTCGGSG